MATKVVSRRWGKPTIFQNDRHPMFGKGLSMVEGDDWVRHRHAIAPSFSSSSLEAMLSLIVESTTKMLDHWSYLVSSGMPEIEPEEEFSKVTGEVIAKAGLGVNYENRIKLVKKIRALQFTLFSSTRYVGVPWGQFFDIKRTMKANRLGKDIDSLMLSSIHAQKSSSCSDTNLTLVGSLLAKQDEGTNDKKTLSVNELVDECKTMMFGGLDTTASMLSWSLLLLALYPEWQTQLRDEIKEVMGDKQIDASMLSELKKIGWVMKEVLRLYPTAPNAQRQAREEIKVNDMVIPKGTNIWIDITSMHHDPDIWRDDVNRFRPERFKEDSYGGARYKMGYMPFGFGGRMCVGRSLATMEYKICLSLILTRFQITLSPNYHHSPATLLTLSPPKGLPLILEPLLM
ncbi:cytokinin hydroxylase-like protein [Tanacetum coccineum]